MTGKQRPFAHLPRAKDEPAQVRALLDAVGADWEFIGRSEVGAVYTIQLSEDEKGYVTGRVAGHNEDGTAIDLARPMGNE